MPEIRILSRNKAIEAKPNTTLLAAAKAAQEEWRHFCGGMALCGTCAVVVNDGELSPPRPNEQMFLDAWACHPKMRLGCQARVQNGDVEVVCCTDTRTAPAPTAWWCRSRRTACRP